MKHELALELKNAGYPQYNEHELKTAEESGGINPGYTKHPSLEELIEACGKEFFSLEQIEDSAYTDGRRMWWATGSNHERGGITAIEAVGYLWLALNKKS